MGSVVLPVELPMQVKKGEASREQREDDEADDEKDRAEVVAVQAVAFAHPKLLNVISLIGLRSRGRILPSRRRSNSSAVIVQMLAPFTGAHASPSITMICTGLSLSLSLMSLLL
jgi:hypothetical protein